VRGLSDEAVSVAPVMNAPTASVVTMRPAVLRLILTPVLLTPYSLPGNGCCHLGQVEANGEGGASRVGHYERLSNRCAGSEAKALVDGATGMGEGTANFAMNVRLRWLVAVGIR
jgi:hypothetical protein